MNKKIILVSRNNVYDDGANITLFADVNDVSEITNEDIDKVYKHEEIVGGSTILTKSFKVGLFDDSRQGVESINWKE